MKKWFDVKKPFIWILIAVLVLSGIGVWFLTRPQLVEISPELDACIRSAIRTEYVSAATEGKYAAVAYTALGAEQKKDAVVVYGVMMYREYTATTQDELKTWGTAQSSFVITAKPTDDGYALAECWWPAKGEDYKASIKKKVPHRYEEKLINYQRYYGPHDLACKADAEANVLDTDKYTVLQSKGANVWLAYQEQGTHGYIASSGGYSAIGTYAFSENEQQVFTFGSCRMVLDVKGDYRWYNAEDSAQVPTAWESSGGIVYLKHGIRFGPVLWSDRAPVGDTLTISGGLSWMTEDEIQKMFGYVPNNSHVTDSAVEPDRPYYLPIKLLRNRTDLDRLLASHTKDTAWKELKQQNFTQFDETFFETNYLVMTYYCAGTYQAEPSVSAYVYTEDGTCLSVRLSVYMPEAGDAAVGQWLLFSGIAKEDTDDIKVLEAYVDSTTSDGDAVTDGALSFIGTVKQIEGTAVLMECTDVPQFSSGVWVELGNTELIPMVGETYVVTYEDLVMPSLPPRITAVTITKP